jgi:hypothetical protein
MNCLKKILPLGRPIRVYYKNDTEHIDICVGKIQSL